MKTERQLVDAIFKTALEGCDANVGARKNAVWLAGSTLLADVLRESDPFTRERLLKGLVPELRGAVADLSRLLDDPPADKPN
jgi:hypothetical protein